MTELNWSFPSRSILLHFWNGHEESVRPTAAKLKLNVTSVGTRTLKHTHTRKHAHPNTHPHTIPLSTQHAWCILCWAPNPAVVLSSCRSFPLIGNWIFVNILNMLDSSSIAASNSDKKRTLRHYLQYIYAVFQQRINPLTLVSMLQKLCRGSSWICLCHGSQETWEGRLGLGCL